MEKIKLSEITDRKTGLSSQTAAQRLAQAKPEKAEKSSWQIFASHTFTYFNILNLILAALVIWTGQYRNLLFMGIVIANWLIGYVQEVRSRSVLKKLALLHAQQYTVLRDGSDVELDAKQIVKGDLVELQAGMQIPADGVIVQGEGTVNESLLTGESDALEKSSGDSLYAGCFLVSGWVLMQAEKCGSETYMDKILQTAKADQVYPSELRDSLNKIIRFSSIILVPAGLLLLAKMIMVQHIAPDQAVLSMVAAVVGMIPEGLVILTSIALASANVKLAKQNVLVQQLYCIENLARVDVLCLDKTGTITTGRMRVKELIAQNDYTKEQIEQTLADLMGSLPDVNASAKAMRNYIKHVKPVQKAKVLFTFNSKNKYSGAGFEGENCYIGAYSFLFSSPDPLVEEQIAKISRSGERVLVLAKGKAAAGADLKDLQLMGLIVLEDELRPDAAEILDYFQKQDVQIKVISGDMLETVEAVASKAGVKGKGISMQNVPDESLCEIMDEYSVFGRVLPAQKMEMVKALEKNGHTVAMVGDGVNDVMALKQADCSIAMGSGSQAARSVASMVLLEDQFAALPEILVEGRRVINNIQRTASLFLVKTLFSFGLCLLSIFWISIYPFVPIQLTMVSALTTGIPAFILTFEPSSARVQGSFLVNVLSKAVPGAISLCFGISMMWICISFGFLAGEDALFQTLCTILAAINGWFVLSSVCRPFTRLRLILLTLSAVSLGVCIVLLPSAFSLVQIGWDAFFYLVITAGLQTALLHILMQANWGRMLEKLSFLQTEKEKIKNIVNTSYR